MAKLFHFDPDTLENVAEDGDLTTEQAERLFTEAMVKRKKAGQMLKDAEALKKEADGELTDALAAVGTERVALAGLASVKITGGKNVQLNREKLSAAMLKAGMKAAKITKVLEAATTVREYTYLAFVVEKPK